MSQTRTLPAEVEFEAIREGVRAACAPFSDDYWLDRDDSGEFPKDFNRAMADGGWLGITVPEEHGGAGYMNEYPIVRLWRDARVRRVYGGSSEIMKDLIGRWL